MQLAFIRFSRTYLVNCTGGGAARFRVWTLYIFMPDTKSCVTFCLYTLHFSTLLNYTLHFTLYTLHFTLYTLHFTLYTYFTRDTYTFATDFTLYTLHNFTLHFTQFHFTLYDFHFTCPRDALYANFTLDFEAFPSVQINFTLYILHFTLIFNVKCKLTLHFTSTLQLWPET